MLQTLSDTCIPLLWGSVLALVLNLPLRAVEAQLTHCSARMRRAWGLVLVLLGLVAVLFLGLWLLIPQLVTAITNISASLPTLYDDFISVLLSLKERLKGNQVIYSAVVFSTGRVEAASESAVSELMNIGVAAATYTAQQAVRLAIALVLAIYLLASKENLAHKARLVASAIFGAKRGRQLVAISQRAGQTFADFMVGQCIEASVLAGLFVLVLLITGMPYVLPIATVIGFTAFVPVFGSFVGCIFGFLLIAAVAPVKSIWFVLIFIVVQQFENNVIYPRVVGKRVGLPPLWVILAVIVGGGLCGLPGLLLGIPAMSVMYQLGGDWVHARIDMQEE
ncbi:MAG: AI-2E family transporter [Faecalibacterium sp.]